MDTIEPTLQRHKRIDKRDISVGKEEELAQRPRAIPHIFDLQRRSDQTAEKI